MAGTSTLFAQVQLFPKQASTMAPKVDALYFYLVSISAFFTVLIAVLIIYFAIRYRRRTKEQLAAQIHGSLKLEIVWTVIPLVLVMTMFFWGAAVYFEMASPPDDAMEIYVVGKQWMWNVQHPGGQRENQELHVPVGRPVKLVMTSQDVIHNFSIPTFRVKADVVPGRYSMLWFTATKPGRYQFFCAEYCGTNHSQMVGWVVAMEPSEFQKWLGRPEVDGSLASKGRKLFLKLQCIACHAADTQNRAPKLEEIYDKEIPLEDGTEALVNEEYLRESILDPDAKIVAGYKSIMPSYQGQVEPEELLQLIAFIKSLKAGQTPARLSDKAPPVVAPDND